MKKLIFVFILSLNYLTVKAQFEIEWEIPKLTGRVVTTYKNALLSFRIEWLEDDLEKLEQSSGVVGAMLVTRIPSGMKINEYAKLVADAWGFGEKDKNSFLIVVEKNGLRPIYCLPGTNLMPVLPDSFLIDLEKKYMLDEDIEQVTSLYLGDIIKKIESAHLNPSEGSSFKDKNVNKSLLSEGAIEFLLVIIFVITIGGGAFFVNRTGMKGFLIGNGVYFVGGILIGGAIYGMYYSIFIGFLTALFFTLCSVWGFDKSKPQTLKEEQEKVEWERKYERRQQRKAKRGA